MKKLLYIIGIPLTMVCCQTESNILEEDLIPSYKCWYANMIGDDEFYGVGRSHSDDYSEYHNKTIYLTENTTFQYRCFRSDIYTEKQMKEMMINEFKR